MKNKQAFTLIELLVVVLIIGILAAVALPQYQAMVDKARYVELIEAGRAIKNAQEIYYLANGEYTKDLSVLDLSMPDTYWSTYTKDLYVGEDARVVLYSRQSMYENAPRFFFMYDHITPTESLLPGKSYCYAHNPRGEKTCKLFGTYSYTKSGLNVYMLN